MDKRKAKRVLAELKRRKLSTPDWFKNSFAEQRDLIEDNHPLKAMQCTRRAGKSYTAGIYAFKAAYETPNSSVIILGLTRDSVKRIFFKDILKDINRELGLKAKANASDLTFTLPNGSVVYLLGVDANPDDKIILFCHHKAAVRTLLKKFKGQAIALYGDTKAKDRKVIERSFQNNSKIRVFIGSQSAAEGLTLTAASTVAFLELWWNPTKHLQAEDRAHRIGQKKVVNIFYLIAVNTVEEHLAKIIQKKAKDSQQVIDGDFDQDSYDLDIFAQLAEEMRNQTRRRIA